MPTFTCNKLARDNVVETCKKDGITLQYKAISGPELLAALDLKLIEEAEEVRDANRSHEVIEELADVLEVIDGMCRAYGIDFNDIVKAKQEKYQERGGFETGLYVESLTMDEDNPRINYFRSSPHKYAEI